MLSEGGDVNIVLLRTAEVRHVINIPQFLKR